MPDDPLPPAVADALTAAAADAPPGRVRLALLEEAVRLADLHRDTAAGYLARRRLIDAAAFCMRYDVYAAAFAWCQAVASADPVRYPVPDLLGHYQNVIGKVVNFPDVSRDQYEALFADVLRQFRTHGYSLRTAYLHRRGVAVDFGDPAMAVAADAEWRQHPRDALSSAPALEAGGTVQHAAFVGDDAAAARAADDYFRRPDRDPWYDAWLSSEALLSYHRLGRVADAAERYRVAAAGDISPGYVWARGYHLEYLAAVGDFARGAREFAAQLPRALAQSDPMSRYYCLRPATGLFARMVTAGVRPPRFAAPPGVPWADRRGDHDPAAVRDWLRAEAAGIAAAFDRRNGNDFFADWLRRTG